MRRIVVVGSLLVIALFTGCGGDIDTAPEGKTERVGRLPKPGGAANKKGGESSK
jgi:hypothetical protein